MFSNTEQARISVRACLERLGNYAGLLLGVVICALCLFAVVPLRHRRQRPALAVGRKLHVDFHRFLAVDLVYALERARVHLAHGARRSWLSARDRVILAVIFARPLGVQGFPGAVHSVRRDLRLVPHFLVDDSGVFAGTGRDLRFCFIQLPGSDRRIIGCQTTHLSRHSQSQS